MIIDVIAESACRSRLAWRGASSAWSAWIRPRRQWRRVRPRHLVGGPHRFGHDLVIGRQVTDRIGPGGIARELERLAAAAAEVQLAAFAAAARIRHPICPAKALEGGRLLPDPGQRVLAYAHP